MAETVELGDIAIDVVRKSIKNIHLRVYPPMGLVRISAPRWMSRERIRLFAVSKFDWITQTRNKLREQEPPARLNYLDSESHFVWGSPCLLKVEEHASAPEVRLDHNNLFLRVRPGSSQEKKQSVLEAWYREQLKVAVPPLVAKWEPLMGVNVSQFFVERMKTRWGTCCPRLKSIRLNSELAKKAPECLEYVVVHELAHLIERRHNDRFFAILDKHLPPWRLRRQELNAAPLRREPSV
jgi:predicted metal-dependent hydrolase